MYRCPRTTQESRANQSCPYARAKRRRRSLPNTWYEIHVPTTKSWKKKRKTQYHLNKRGQHHEVFLDLHYNDWEITEYFKTQNIPFSLDPIQESGYNKYVNYKRVVVRTIPDYYYFWRRIDGELKRLKGHQIGFKAIYEWKPCGYTTYCCSYTVGYKLVWWSDKDIGVEYILNANIRA